MTDGTTRRPRAPRDWHATAQAAWQRVAGSNIAKAPAGAGPSSAWLDFVPEGVRSLLRTQPGADQPGGWSVPPASWSQPLHRTPPEPNDAPHTPRPDPSGAGGQFLYGTFTSEAGTRPYRLYVPGSYAGQRVPLIVMLHGCMQSPEDFAAGTGMNAAAEEHGFLVVYPGQPAAAHAQRCWKWFSAQDQRRDHGEPAIIAGITRLVMAEYEVDPARVHVAGLSAGGAEAAILGQAYPDLYASIGVHSGLACGAAQDLPSALLAMQRGNPELRHRRHSARARPMPAIVFHGDRDSVVSPRNAEDVVAQLAQGAGLRISAEDGQDPGSYPYRRTLYRDATGRPVIEQWSLLGAGHAWSGGSEAGSYTDRRGPDATREMVRFFAEHPHPAPPS
ncbi:extracellular catalytic domain type 1 short-chain-length polyhydroxyalkanoate depolymerase [Lichenicoccus roseus]|uniref:PHB depolymerase family esterase n=1 Tax=Lichenicoccus roseus TaxID=2683649 RepID=A0A5R9J4L4_9PROT|nr:PHB depolymerase family esterase [Lichenicoccus roseus]TLU71447.1 PHB depolymerase family esterase [Lichenicoccus roseus]